MVSSLGSLARARVPLAVPEARTAEHRAERNAFVWCPPEAVQHGMRMELQELRSRRVAFGASDQAVDIVREVGGKEK
jgi:hypothetical protein